jgi:hypothetical protein
VIGRWRYLVGGTAGTTALASVERAPINPGGTLGTFTDAGVSLVTLRRGHTAVVIGPWLYVIGGARAAGTLGTVERAAIAADGTLGAFATVSGVDLVAVREHHTSVVIQSYLYMTGGDGPGDTDTIERATIAADGSLGDFATVAA